MHPQYFHWTVKTTEPKTWNCTSNVIYYLYNFCNNTIHYLLHASFADNYWASRDTDITVPCGKRTRCYRNGDCVQASLKTLCIPAHRHRWRPLSDVCVPCLDCSSLTPPDQNDRRTDQRETCRSAAKYNSTHASCECFIYQSKIRRNDVNQREIVDWVG